MNNFPTDHVRAEQDQQQEPAGSRPGDSGGGRETRSEGQGGPRAGRAAHGWEGPRTDQAAQETPAQGMIHLLPLEA